MHAGSQNHVQGTSQQLHRVARRVRHRRGPDPRRAVRSRRRTSPRVDVRHRILAPDDRSRCRDQWRRRCVRSSIRAPVGAETMGAGKYGSPDGTTTRTGRAGGAQTLPSTHRSSSSPTISDRRSRWTAGPCSTSSTPHLPKPSPSPAPRSVSSTSESAVDQPSSATSSPPARRRRPHRRHADRARTRRARLGRARDPRAAVRHRSDSGTQRRHPPHPHQDLITGCSADPRATRVVSSRRPLAPFGRRP